MTITIYNSNGCEQQYNTEYPNKHTLTDKFDSEIFSKDYVCATFTNNQRKLSTFLEADCIGMDCDNTHSDEPSTWVTPEDVAEAFPGVPFWVHYSRNHLKEKNGKAVRPKFHVLFPIYMCKDAEAYRSIKQQACDIFPYFDSNALDAARFFFGTEHPKTEYHSGTMYLDDYLEAQRVNIQEPQRTDLQSLPGRIMEGKRNSTLSR